MRFFEYVSKHCGFFLGFEVVYILLVLILCNKFHADEWVHCVFIAPVNLISWPVALAGKKEWRIWRTRYERGAIEFSFIIAVFTAVWPLAYVFFYL